VANINDLKNRIEAAIATVHVDMLQHTWMELKYHLYIVCMINDSLLNMCNVQNKLLRVSLIDNAHSICLRLFIKLLFTSKVINIVYIYPAIQWQ
jgi:hypothetical protein